MTHMIAAPNGVHRAVYELHTYMYVQKCTGCCTDDKMYVQVATFQAALVSSSA